MNRFLKCMHSEYLKLLYLKSTKIIIALVVLLQSGLAYLAGKQILSVGLNATLETNKNLLEAIPPIEYLGFDVILFGLLPMIVLGAIYGASEYKAHSMRTSLLSVNKKSMLFIVKLWMILVISFVISLISIMLTISITHISIGNTGINAFILTPSVWKFIVLGSVSWTGLTVLAFVIGFLFRTAIVPLLFLIPQVYNIGNFLAERFWAAKFLPVAVGNGLIAVSEKIFTKNPLHNILFLIAWISFFGILAYIRFIKSDLSGEY